MEAVSDLADIRRTDPPMDEMQCGLLASLETKLCGGRRVAAASGIVIIQILSTKYNCLYPT